MWKAYLGLLAFISLGSFVAIHIQQDKYRNLELRQAAGQMKACLIDASQSRDEIAVLNSRIKQANERLMAQVEQDRIRLENAKAAAAKAQSENDRIGRELAAARAHINGITDPTFTNWAGQSVPADAIHSLQRNAD